MGTVTYSLFSFILIFHDFLCVGYLIDHVYFFLAFDFWNAVLGTRIFSIWFLASTFWHTVFEKAFRQHFFGNFLASL